MHVLVYPDAAAVAVAAAERVGVLLAHKPEAVLALPTGNTPLAMYDELVRRQLDWSLVTTFNLDEYVGLGPEHPASYHHYMREHLVKRTNLQRCHLPNGQAADLEAECHDYERAIAQAGGIDLAILGIGQYGHLAFNEPPSALRCRTRVVRLAPSTRRINAAQFPAGETPPTHALTVGLGTVLEARSVLLLATGANKAEILARAVEGPVSAMVPASALQLHSLPVILADEAAASRLTMREYYREAYGP